MAISKAQKQELVEKYKTWVNESQAVYIAEYLGLTVGDIDALRKNAREVGGEFHIIKNTLGKRAFMDTEMPDAEQFFIGSTAIGFAFDDPPGMAKVLAEFAKEHEALKFKVGYLDKELLSAEQISALAKLPPMPVMRAQLLSTILAPANKLARVLAEPARGLASVIKAYSEKEESVSAA